MDFHKIVDKNWDVFKDRFESREALKSHFLALKNYRNPLGHARDVDVVEQKQGEAAIIWLRRAVSTPIDSDITDDIEPRGATTRTEVIAPKYSDTGSRHRPEAAGEGMSQKPRITRCSVLTWSKIWWTVRPCVLLR